jgi:hypothetical protein
MGANKNSSRRRLKLQQDELARSDPQNHTLHTSTFRLPKPRSHWSATGPRNKHTSNLNSYAPTTAETREPTVQRGRLDRVLGAVRPSPPGNQEILRNTSSEHQNAPRFHQQRSLVNAMLATRKSWRKPKLHPGANGRFDRLPGWSNLLYPAKNSKQELLANGTKTTQNFTQTLL